MLAMLVNLSEKVQLFERLFDNQLLVCESLPCHTTHNDGKSLCVIPVAIIEPESLLIQVTGKMVNLTTYIRSAKRPLEETPIVLYPVGVNVPPYVFGRMVNGLMDKLFLHALIGFQCVR